MSRKYRASIIIPAYNEEEGIALTLEAIFLMKFGEKYEVIVVNDGSTDKTAEIVKKYDVRLINHNTNKGYGAALKTGIRNASSEKVITMDSDGQHLPEYLPKIVDLLDEYPMVIGERTADSHQIAKRTLGKKIIRIIGEYLVEQKLPDYNSGFRGFNRRFINSMLHIMPNGFSFSTTSTLAFLKQGCNFATIPIHVTARVGRASNVKFIRDGSKTILLICRVIMLFNPLKVFFPASIIIGFAGLMWGIYGIVCYQRFPNTAVMVLVFGMFLFFIGLLTDQISMLNLRAKVEDDEREV